MKKRIVLLLSCLVIAAFSACTSAPRNEWTVTDGITARLAQDTYPIGVKAMTLILENHTDQVMLYGQGWRFEKKVCGLWTAVETKANTAFTQEGHILDAFDKKTMIISTDMLRRDLSAGLYRVIGLSPLHVAQDAEKLQKNDYKDYPAYRLEFRVTSGAADEPESAAQPSPGLWELPAKEDWQWYTWWQGIDMYKRSGMDVCRYIEMAGGLEAYLYRRLEDNGDVDFIEDGDKMMLDIFDRTTGERYIVYDEPTVETDQVSAADGGLIIRTENGSYFATVFGRSLVIEKRP